MRHGSAVGHDDRLCLSCTALLVEFKNYDSMEIGKDEVNQTRNYLTKPLGRLALIVSTKEPNRAAHVKRNSVYTLWGSRTRPPVLTWASTRLARIR